MKKFLTSFSEYIPFRPIDIVFLILLGIVVYYVKKGPSNQHYCRQHQTWELNSNNWRHPNE